MKLKSIFKKTPVTKPEVKEAASQVKPEVPEGLLKRCNKYIDETMPWALAKDETKKDRLPTVLYNLIEAIRFSAVMLYPYMPSTSTKILDQINTDQRDFESLKEFGMLECGRTVDSKPEILFARIDMKEFMEKLEADKKAQEKAEAKASKENKKDVKEEISIEDFTNSQSLDASYSSCGCFIL